ncbi:MAG: hypothetical protein V1774_09705 [Candidatus Eisenbacteria bacterium]
MPHEISLDERNAVVRVRVSGAATHEEHLAARLEAAGLCRAKGWPRMLVDLRDLKTAETVTTVSCFEFGSSYRTADLPDACRIAHILPQAARARRDVEFVATVGLNRGILLRNFTDSDEAMRWLVQPPGASSEAVS